MRQFLSENILQELFKRECALTLFHFIYQIYWYIKLISKNYFYKKTNIGEHKENTQRTQRLRHGDLPAPQNKSYQAYQTLMSGAVFLFIALL